MSEHSSLVQTAHTRGPEALSLDRLTRHAVPEALDNYRLEAPGPFINKPASMADGADVQQRYGKL